MKNNTYSDFADQCFYSLWFNNQERKSKFQIEIGVSISDEMSSDFDYLNKRVEDEFVYGFKKYFLEYQDYINFHLNEYKWQKADFVQHLANSIQSSISKTKASLYTEKKRAESGFPTLIEYRLQGIKEREIVLDWIKTELLPIIKSSSNQPPVHNKKSEYSPRVKVLAHVFKIYDDKNLDIDRSFIKKGFHTKEQAYSFFQKENDMESQFKSLYIKFCKAIHGPNTTESNTNKERVTLINGKNILSELKQVVEILLKQNEYNKGLFEANLLIAAIKENTRSK